LSTKKNTQEEELLVATELMIVSAEVGLVQMLQ
jgi:hypothetical protein